jgi:hypothetical protein
VTNLPLDPALRLVVGADPTLHPRLDRLVRETRVVFFAGLPGTGKRLCLHQLAHLAQAAGRVVLCNGRCGTTCEVGRHTLLLGDGPAPRR